MEKFAERLRELRMEKNLSIQALATTLKIGHSSISRWENNQSNITGSQLIALAKFFGVTTDYLLGLSEYR